MKKVDNLFLKLVIVILTVALCISFGKISRLEDQLTNLDSHHSNQIGSLRQNIESIYRNVDEKLRQEASLLSGVEAKFGKLNHEEHTVEVELMVLPKLVSEDTALEVSIQGRRTALQRVGSTFTGTIPVDLFTDGGEQMLLSITTAGGLQTEYLEDVSLAYLWPDYLPTLYHCEITEKGTYRDGKYVLDTELIFDSSPVQDTPDVLFEKIEMVTEADGQVIDRDDITAVVQNYAPYPGGVYYWGTYQQTYDVGKAQEVRLTLEATDSLGYVHKMVLDHWVSSNDAYPDVPLGIQSIYDSNGKLLYGKE